MTPFETIESENYVLEFHHDKFPDNPRSWDNLGTIVGWHHRYNVGDKHNYATPAEFLAEWNSKNAIVLPVFMYEHSGTWLSTSNEYPFNDRWDAGQVGWIYVSLDKVRKEYSIQRVNKRVRQLVSRVLQQEVNIYSCYVCGNAFGYVLKNKATDEIEDSCWGYFGPDDREYILRDVVPEEVRLAA